MVVAGARVVEVVVSAGAVAVVAAGAGAVGGEGVAVELPPQEAAITKSATGKAFFTCPFWPMGQAKSPCKRPFLLANREVVLGPGGQGGRVGTPFILRPSQWLV